MKINRLEFLENLAAVKAGLSAREFIEQSSCYVFQKGWVMTFNDEVACRKKLSTEENPFTITGAVQAASLLAILEKMEDPELLVAENENGELEFKGKKKSFAVTKDAEIFLPISRVEKPLEWVPLTPKFSHALKFVKHCVSKDESRFLLTCIHIHPEFIEACDNLQMMRCKCASNFFPEPLLVRGTSIDAMLSLSMEEVAVTPSWIHFKNHAGLVYSCRKYSEDYPDLGEILKVKGEPVHLPKGVALACGRAAVFANDKSGDPLVTVTLSNGMIRILGTGLSGWYRETKKVVYDGPPLEFAIAPELLMHISEKYNDAKISERKMKVTGDEEGMTWQYITVLGKASEIKESEGQAEGKTEPKKRKKPADDQGESGEDRG